MDSGRFDNVARSLGRGASRRSALAAALAAGLGIAVPAAAKGGRGKGQGPRPAGTLPALKNCGGKKVGAGASLSSCNFTASSFAGLNLTNAVLSSASLVEANLAGANLTRAVLSSANLAGANLSGAVLKNAVLSSADLTDANLCGANLTGAVVKASQIAAAEVCCSTILPDGKSAAPCAKGTGCVATRCVVGADSPCDPANPVCPDGTSCVQPVGYQPYIGNKHYCLQPTGSVCAPPGISNCAGLWCAPDLGDPRTGTCDFGIPTVDCTEATDSCADDTSDVHVNILGLCALSASGRPIALEDMVQPDMHTDCDTDDDCGPNEACLLVDEQSRCKFLPGQPVGTGVCRMATTYCNSGSVAECPAKAGYVATCARFVGRFGYPHNVCNYVRA